MYSVKINTYLENVLKIPGTPGLEPAPPGIRPGALITKPYVLIKRFIEIFICLLQLIYVVVKILLNNYLENV